MPDCRRLEAAELGRALGLLLAVPGDGRPAGAGPVQDFRNYLRDSGVPWFGFQVSTGDQFSALFFSLILPGRTAVVMLPNPGELGIDEELQLDLTRTGLAALADRSLHYAQLLLEPEAAARRTLALAAGFRFLAPLRYLERDITYPWTDPPPPASAAWVPYGPASHADFAAVVAATYERSLDCPELTGIRPIEDVLAAHKAAGPFDPSLWELVRVGNQPAGCLLLSRVAQGAWLDVVYMGVVPSQRGRGVGELLLRRALVHCRRTGARRLTVVVDDRNAPARRLYERFGMRPLARRDAYWWRGGGTDG